VWNFTTDEEERLTNCCLTKCKLCFKDVSVKVSNTSNLLKHLCLHQHSKFAAVSYIQEAQSLHKIKSKGDKQPTLQHCFEQTSHNSKEQRKLSVAVTNFIVRDVMPIYTVEKDGFCAMDEALNPS